MAKPMAKRAALQPEAITLSSLRRPEIAEIGQQLGSMTTDAPFHGGARRPARRRKWLALSVLALLVAGFLLPQRLVIPVRDATAGDWNHATFWHHPWGRSVTHKGIDIFAAKGTPALSASHGIVVFSGTLGYGGRVVIALGPKWRFHYYAHLDKIDAGLGQWLVPGQPLGSVGDSGNAAGKPPHLHYSVFTPMPYPWLYQSGPQSYLRPFFLNPHELLTVR